MSESAAKTKTKPKHTRSRFGCHNCKKLKVKCSETKPKCTQCTKIGVRCDYSLTLKWGATTCEVGSLDTASAEVNNQKSIKLDVKSFSFINANVNAVKKRKYTKRQNVEKAVGSQLLNSKLDNNDSTQALDMDQLSTSGNIDNMVDNQLFQPHERIYHVWDNNNNNGDNKEIELYSIHEPLHILPDLLLNNKFYYESFMFFCDQTAKMLVSANSDVSYTENPFQKILPKLAVADDGILCLMLSFGICHKASVLHIEPPPGVMERLRSRSLVSLNSLLANKKDMIQDDDIILTIVILLASLDIFSASETGEWKVHVNYAKKILNDRGLTFSQIYKRFSQNHLFTPESDMLIFLFRWLAYMDVVALLVSPVITNYAAKQSIYNHDEDIESYCHPLMSMCITKQNDIPRISIDPFLGFDIRLLPLFDAIIQLIKESNENQILSVEIVNKALILEHNVKQTNFASNLQRMLDPKFEDALYSTNSIFCYTSLLVLYRRILHVDRSSSLIQGICHDIKSEIEQNLKPGSSAELCSMFCIFTASVESVEESLQSFFDERLSRLVDSGNTCVAKKAYKVVHRTWQTGNNWTDVAKEMMATNLTFI